MENSNAGTITHPKEHRAEIAHVDPSTACFTLEKMLGFIGRLLPMACR